jgi:hypothetical protein
MKIITSLLLFLLSSSVAVSSAADVENCDLQLVADARTCNTYCIEEKGHNASYYIPATTDRDTSDGNHVDILIGFECHCHNDDDMDGHNNEYGSSGLPAEDYHSRENGDEGTTNTNTGWIDHSKHLICWIPYTIPTCKEVATSCVEHTSINNVNTTASVARNATATTTTTTTTFGSCDEYCSSIGLESTNTYCHVMMTHYGDENDPDHTHGDDVELGLCFCDSEAVGQGIMTCGDDGWEAEAEHADDDDHDTSGANIVSLTSLVAVASILVTMTL